MVTIKDIANKVGVSIGTVDRVIHNRGRVSEETKERILQVMEELHYRPNFAGQDLVSRRKRLKFTFFHVDPVKFPFYEDVVKGAAEKARELEQYGAEVTFCQLDVAEVVPQAFLTVSDGIVVLGGSHPAAKHILNYAKEQKIPAVCYNIPLVDEAVLANVGCDYIQSGRLAAGLCAIASGERGTVGILTEDDGEVYSFQQRFLGFRQELEKQYPQIHIAGVYPSTDYAGGSEEAARQMLREHPSINLVYLVNPGDYSVCHTIKAVNPAIRIITNDLPSSQRQLLQDGTITATICQEPEKQGALPLELLYQFAARKILPDTKDYYVALSIQIRQNV